MSPSDPKDPNVIIVQTVVDSLGEHFDTVQVFVTRHEAAASDGTRHLAIGSGNFFARYGQVQMWIASNDQGVREETKQKPIL